MPYKKVQKVFTPAQKEAARATREAQRSRLEAFEHEKAEHEQQLY